MKSMSIGSRLNGMVAILLVIACTAVISISVLLSRNALEDEILSSTLLAKTAEVVSAVDKQFVSPATTLEAMARHPLFLDWVEMERTLNNSPSFSRPAVITCLVY